MTRGSALFVLLLLACGTPGPVALRWDEESCRHCHMILADRRFGAEVVTTRGRALSFDDAGCAANHLATGATPAAEVSSVWVIDYTHPGILIAADSALFVRSSAFHTPMGSGVVATPTLAAATALVHQTGGIVLTWDQVLAAARAGGLGAR